MYIEFHSVLFQPIVRDVRSAGITIGSIATGFFQDKVFNLMLTRGSLIIYYSFLGGGLHLGWRASPSPVAENYLAQPIWATVRISGLDLLLKSACQCTPPKRLVTQTWRKRTYLRVDESGVQLQRLNDYPSVKPPSHILRHTNVIFILPITLTDVKLICVHYNQCAVVQTILFSVNEL